MLDMTNIVLVIARNLPYRNGNAILPLTVYWFMSKNDQHVNQKIKHVWLFVQYPLVQLFEHVFHVVQLHGKVMQLVQSLKTITLWTIDRDDWWSKNMKLLIDDDSTTWRNGKKKMQENGTSLIQEDKELVQYQVI